MSMRTILAIGLVLFAGALSAQVILPSDISVSLAADPSTNLLPGEPVRLTITVKNNGQATVNDFEVESAPAYPDQIYVGQPNTDCLDIHFEVADGATFFYYTEVWTPTDTTATMRGNWPLQPGESRSCHVTISLYATAAQSVPFDFHLGGYWQDSNPGTDFGRVTLVRAAVQAQADPIPSTYAPMLFLLCGTIAFSAVLARRKRD